MRHKTPRRLPVQRRPAASHLPRTAGPFGGCFKLCLGLDRPEREAFLDELENPNVLGKAEGVFWREGVGRTKPTQPAAQRLPFLGALQASSFPLPHLPCTFLYFQRGREYATAQNWARCCLGFLALEFSSRTFRQAKPSAPARLYPLAPQACASGGGWGTASPPPRTRPRLTFPGKPLQPRFPVTSRCPRPSCSFRFLFRACADPIVLAFRWDPAKEKGGGN